MNVSKINFLTVALLLVLLVINISPVNAQVKYFVSTTGDDAKSGRTIANAFASIQFAINQVTDGDIINVVPGTYTYATSSGILIDRPLTLQATTFGVFINGLFSVTSGIIVTTTGVKISHIALQNLTTGIFIDESVPFGGSVQIFGSLIGTTSDLVVTGINNQSLATISAFGNSWNSGLDPVANELLSGRSIETIPYMLSAPDPAFPFGAEPNLPWGDITLNGSLTPLDASKALKHTLGGEDTQTGDAFNIGDISIDGTLNETDAVLMLKKVVQLITIFEIEKFKAAKRSLPNVRGPKFIIAVNREEGEAVVTVALNKAKKVYSAYLEFLYDESVLQFKEFRRISDESSAGILIEGNGADGVGRIVAASANVFGRETQLGELVFTILDTNRGIYISSEYFRINGFDGTHRLAVGDAVIPEVFELLQNYPNPFNPETTISFRLPEISDVTIRIFNILGQEVKVFNLSGLSTGIHEVKWRGLNSRNIQVSSGVYIYMMQANGRIINTKKMLFIK